MLTNGYIKLHRRLLDWEWYDDIATTRLFIHLLLTVNIKDSQWHGEFIPAGSRVTTISELSKEAGLTQKQIRGSLDKLIRANAAAKVSTPNYSVISIVNWEKYQAIGQTKGQTEGKQQGKRGANEGQQNKKDKNIKKKEISTAHACAEQKFSFESNPYKCALFLSKRLAERVPNKITSERTLQSWAVEMDKVNRLDGRPWEEIAAVLDFSQSNQFWSTSIVNARLFRDKYDQLYLKMKAEEENNA